MIRDLVRVMCLVWGICAALYGLRCLYVCYREQLPYDPPRPLYNTAGICYINSVIQLLRTAWYDYRLRGEVAEQVELPVYKKLNALTKQVMTLYDHSTSSLESDMIAIERAVYEYDDRFDMGGLENGLWWYVMSALLGRPVGLVDLAPDIVPSAEFGIVACPSWLPGVEKEEYVTEGCSDVHALLRRVLSREIKALPRFFAIIGVQWDTEVNMFMQVSYRKFPLYFIARQRGAIQTFTYECIGILAASEAHAVAFVRRRDSWYICDDSFIEPVTQEFMNKAAQSGHLPIPHPAPNNVAVPTVLLYKRCTGCCIT